MDNKEAIAIKQQIENAVYIIIIAVICAIVYRDGNSWIDGFISPKIEYVVGFLISILGLCFMALSIWILCMIACIVAIVAIHYQDQNWESSIDSVPYWSAVGAIVTTVLCIITRLLA